MQKLDRLSYWLVVLGLCVALGLSFISWLRLCTQACMEGHNYRFFGFTFETVAFVSFPTILAIHLISYRFCKIATLSAWLLCAVLGGEIILIYVQKYKIGSWCPICLLIAASLALSGLAYFYQYYTNFKISLERSDKGEIMNIVCKGCTGIVFFLVGFLLAFGGIDKYNHLQAAESSVAERIAFGKLDSPVTVYIFTDWACPGCRSLESNLEAMAPSIMSKAKLVFVDDPVHKATMNFTPYNLSFMIYHKPQYFALRHGLTTLSEDTDEPTDEQIEALAIKQGLNYRHLNYADIALATKHFKELIRKLKVEGTPTVVVVNNKTKQGKKLEGNSEITEANVTKAIDKLLD